MSRLIPWLIACIGGVVLLTLGLLLLAVGTLALTLASLVRGVDGWLLLRSAVAALLAGWWLGRLRLSGWVAALLLAGAGVVVTLLLVGRLSSTALRMLAVLAGVSGQPALAALAGELWTGSATLLSRLSAWASGLLSGAPAYDPAAAALFWSLLVWIVAAFAGFRQRRGSLTLQALLPAGAVLTGALAYVGGDALPLLPFLAATLLLTAFSTHVHREQRWQTEGIDFSDDIRLDLVLVSLPLLLLLLTLAALAPALSLNSLSNLAQRLYGEPISQAPAGRSFGLEPAPAPTSATDAFRSPGLPRSHLIGAGPELSQQIVMAVSTGDQPGMPGDPERQPPRYYWRGLTYDLYTGRGWRSSATTTSDYQAGEPVAADTASGHRRVRHTIEGRRDLGGLLYAAGSLISTSEDFSVAWRAPGDLFAAQIASQEYAVDSLTPALDEARLRGAGSAYPDWVTQRYLALPDSVPARVLALARDLTATAPTPYDRAKAIERYLREFPYTLDVPEPPLDVEISDYFLFDLQRGYCDYYATSMVVLARAAGLPARLAVGYVGGSYDRTIAGFLLSEAEAHSWPEIYFPGYGWIEFEPTAGRPPLARDALSAGELRELEAPLERAPLAPAGSGWWSIIAGLAVLLPAAIAIWSAVDRWRLRRLAPQQTLEVIYRRLLRQGVRLQPTLQPGATPFEFVTMLADALKQPARRRWWAAAIAPAAGEAHWLARLYVQAAYSPHALRQHEQTQAIAIWRRLVWRLLLARLSAMRRS